MGHAPITYWSTWFFMLTVIVFQKLLASAIQNFSKCWKVVTKVDAKIPLTSDLVNEPLVTSFSQLLFLHSSFDFSSDTRMRRFLTNISRFGIFVEKIVCFTRFFSAPHWYISSRQKIKIGANIIYISLKKMISPFISGYNLVENPLIFSKKNYW